MNKDSKGRFLHCFSINEKNPIALTKMTCEYTQDADCSSDIDYPNSIVISTEPEGYVTIQTERFAFDTKEEVIDLINDFLSRVEFEKSRVEFEKI